MTKKSKVTVDMKWSTSFKVGQWVTLVNPDGAPLVFSKARVLGSAHGGHLACRMWIFNEDKMRWECRLDSVWTFLECELMPLEQYAVATVTTP
jgi:hypothetical protein